jgi:PhzF family phenazine biosynthesis protein
MISIYHVNAFSDKLFAGNPASVCILEKWLPDNTLQTIAAENHLPVTAFLLRDNKKFSIRWFTPEYEIDLCGHGTLAAGYVIFNYLETEAQQVELDSPAGLLRVSKESELITLDFPVRHIEKCAVSEILERGIGIKPRAIFQYKSERCLAVFDSEEQVKQAKPDMQILRELPYRSVIITARGEQADFVSRVFYPRKQLSEDAVTGSSHCLLVPYWSKELNKLKLHSRQLSHRGGDLFCELKNDRVFISGKAVIYMQGAVLLSHQDIDTDE